MQMPTSQMVFMLLLALVTSTQAQKSNNPDPAAPMSATEKDVCQKEFQSLQSKGLPGWVPVDEMGLLFESDEAKARETLQKILSKREIPNLRLIPKSITRDEEASLQNPGISVEIQNQGACEGGMGFFDDGLPGGTQRVVICITRGSAYQSMVTGRHEILHAYQDNLARKHPGAAVIQKFIDDQLTYVTPPGGKFYHAKRVAAFTPNVELIEQKNKAHSKQVERADGISAEARDEVDQILEEIKNFGSLNFGNESTSSSATFQMQKAGTSENATRKFMMILNSPGADPLKQGFGQWLAQSQATSLLGCKNVMAKFPENDMPKDHMPLESFAILPECFQKYVNERILPRVKQLSFNRIKYLVAKQTTNCVNHILNYCYEMQTNSADCWTRFMSTYTAEKFGLSRGCRSRALFMDYESAKQCADEGKWDSVDKLCSRETNPGGMHRLGIYEIMFSSYPYSKLSPQLCSNTTEYLQKECSVGQPIFKSTPDEPKASSIQH